MLVGEDLRHIVHEPRHIVKVVIIRVESEDIWVDVVYVICRVN